MTRQQEACASAATLEQCSCFWRGVRLVTARQTAPGAPRPATSHLPAGHRLYCRALGCSQLLMCWLRVARTTHVVDAVVLHAHTCCASAQPVC